MKSPTSHPRGAALLITLLLVGLLAVVLTAFFLAAGSSRRRAVSDREHSRARLYIDLAVQEAVGKIATGFAEVAGPPGEVRGSVTASPGLMEIRYYQNVPNRGSERGAAAFTLANPARPPFFRNPFAESYVQGTALRPANPRWIPLFSWKWFAPAVPNLKLVKGAASEPNPDFNPAAVFDINTTKNPFHPGHHYLTGVPAAPVALRYQRDAEGRFAERGREGEFRFQPGEAAADRPVWVQWIPVLRDPEKKPGDDNPMIGRYAYWVDVENTKVNLLASTRPLRQSEFFGLLTGESDAEAGVGDGHFEQSPKNPYRQALAAVEAALPREGRGQDGTRTADGRPGQGSNHAARTLRDLLLGWRQGQKPFAADNSVVDWDYFAGLRPRAEGRGEKIAFDDLLGELARAVEANPELTLNSWEEIFSLLDPALQTDDPKLARLVRDSLRRVLAPATTIYGHEDERDPLGRPKIDLVKFLLEARKYAGAGGSPAGLKGTELWARLADPKYHRAYHPAAYASGGAARSFISSFNRFAGTGNPSDDLNGELAVQQMLLNVLEYTLPDSVPPHLNPDTGLVAMRSVPYVAEVATRARSALWLLPAELRAQAATLAAQGATYEGKPMSYYLTHVIVDVALGCMNPDPFSSRFFDGTLKLDYAWHGLPAGAAVMQGPQTAPLRGRFTALPLPGEKPGKVRVDGDAVVFRLGVVPGETLVKKEYATALRIRGWEIRDGAGLWHQVPIKHLRAASAPQWWQMAEPGANAGSTSDSLVAYQEDPANFGHRAVGWFTAQANRQARGIFLTAQEAADPARVARFVADAQKATWVERVQSRDPALGHRTGNRALIGTRGRDASHQKGHFYGLLGHTWRHGGTGMAKTIEEAPPSEPGEDEPEDPYVDDDGDDEIETRTLTRTEYTSGDTHLLRAGALLPRGVFYEHGHATATLPTVRATGSTKLTAKTWKQSAGQLTGFFSDPAWERPFPLGDFDAKPGDKGAADENIDIETAAAITTIAGVKTKELRLGAQGLFCGAPRGQVMTSLGELGFCHSGFPNFPILLTAAAGWNEYLLNCPRNGPPMRMLLDLFTPGAFTDAATRRPVDEAAWRSGNYTSHSPPRPRRGTWNMNTALAHDSYLAIREGDTDHADLKKEFDPLRMPVRVAWVPASAGWRRLEDAAEWARGKKLDEVMKGEKTFGLPLDRYSAPEPVLNRALGAWVSLLGGDFSRGRVTGGTRWGFNNAGAVFFGPGLFTWQPGNSAVPLGSDVPFADFSGQSAVDARLLTFGSDGRKEGADKGDRAGYLRGRFAADQNLGSTQTNPPVALPLTQATRFSLLPMRHFVSDLAEEFQLGAAFADFKTPLNARAAAGPPPEQDNGEIAWKKADGAAFPGGHHAAGLFANAPIALLANQVSTSANVFTIHVVAQVVQDRGARRAGVRNSGPGHSDPDDLVVAERWARVTLERLPPREAADPQPRFRRLGFAQAGE
jgi:hypothetical protein